jgi:hypothetical protein
MRLTVSYHGDFHQSFPRDWAASALRYVMSRRSKLRRVLAAGFRIIDASTRTVQVQEHVLHRGIPSQLTGSRLVLNNWYFETALINVRVVELLVNPSGWWVVGEYGCSLEFKL